MASLLGALVEILHFMHTFCYNSNDVCLAVGYYVIHRSQCSSIWPPEYRENNVGLLQLDLGTYIGVTKANKEVNWVGGYFDLLQGW